MLKTFLFCVFVLTVSNYVAESKSTFHQKSDAYADVASPYVPEVKERTKRHVLDYKDNDCLKQKITYYLPQINEGIPAMQLPSMNPWIINEWKYDDGFTVISMQDNTVFGLKATKINIMSFNPYDLLGRVKITTPKLRLKSKTHVKGKFFNRDVDNEANYFWILDNVAVDVRYKLAKKDGPEEEHMTIDKMDVNVEIDNAKLQIQAINPDDQDRDNELAERMQTSNTQVVLSIISRYYSNFIKENLKTHFNNFFAHRTAGDILQDTGRCNHEFYSGPNRYKGE